MEYRRDIDGLRAVAVLPVLFFHAKFPGFSGGYVGVDVFFVISGYLITRLLMSDLAQERFSLWRFYERRARRILPALFLVVVVSLPFAWFWMLPEQLDGFGRSLMAVAFFVSNILFWREEGYFAPSADLKPLLHTWSLSVEEQFYILFPLVLLLIWRYGRRALLPILTGLAVASFSLTLWALSDAGLSQRAVFFLTAFRGWELMVGAGFAIAAPARPNTGFASIGLALILCAVVWFDDATPMPGPWAAMPVFGTALILRYAGGSGTFVGRFLSLRLFVGIGLISYSLYLWHQPIYALARIRTVSGLGPADMLGLIALSIVLAAMSWRFVEQPIRRRPAPVLRTRRAVFGASALATVMVAGMGAVFWIGAGFPGHMGWTETQRAYLDTATPSPKRNACHTAAPNYMPPSQACTYFAPTPDVVVLGDSHAVELSYALAEALRDDGLGVRHLSFSSCVPVLDPGPDATACAHWTQQALELIDRLPELRHVVVTYRILPIIEMPDGDARLADLDRMLDRIATRVPVTYVAQAPELPFPMRKIVQNFKSFAKDDNLRGGDRRDWVARSAAFAAWGREEESKTNVDFLDLADIFCDKTICYAGRGGAAYYFDDNHMSVAGARVAAAPLADRIRAQRRPGAPDADPVHRFVDHPSGGNNPNPRR